MKTVSTTGALVLGAAWLWTGQVRAAEVVEPSEFRPLFNGKDLSGWVNVNCAPDTWIATNGLIACTGVPIGELRTDRMFQNFVLELEWRHLQAGGNAGVFVWADALTARGEPFIRGVEVQVLDGREGPTHTSDGDIFPIHGARMTPSNGRGGDRAFPTEKRAKPSPEWNHYRIECIEGAISLAVNGKVVTRGSEASPRKGYICLESEGSPVEFRNLRIRELPEREALPPEAIANPAEGFLSLYNGRDFSGWRTGAGGEAGWRSRDWILECDGTKPGAPLIGEAVSGDGVWILDWRWRDTRRSGDWRTLLRPRGVDLTSVLTQVPAGLEQAAGKWNRVQCQIRGNRMRLEVNGKPIGEGFELTGVPAKGRTVLVPAEVPVEVANLYFKRLD